MAWAKQIMIGPDGKNYPVPANYASKSKLIEGDILKLTITPNLTIKNTLNNFAFGTHDNSLAWSGNCFPVTEDRD